VDDYLITSHAAFEMQRRGIEESIVRSVLAAPEQRHAVGTGWDVLQSRFVVGGKRYLVRVFAALRRRSSRFI
jgi:hypothetical protein